MGERKSEGELAAAALRALADALEACERSRTNEPPQCAPAFAKESEVRRISGLTRQELWNAVANGIVGVKKNGEASSKGAVCFRVSDAVRLADSKCVGGVKLCGGEA